jgi:type I protein arginine methyltransferase
MYSLHGYGEMISDSVRMDAYTRAMRQAIHPGSVVVDLGTGPGIFALLACQYGAGHVYAVEPADVIQVAREIARANHVEERITFLQDLSSRVELPVKADVIISDIRDVLPLFQHHVLAIADARRRLLADGGTLIPWRDTLWAAVVDVPELYQDNYSTPWERNRYDLNMSAARQKVVNFWRKARIKSQDLLTEAQCWATLDYTCIENPDIHATTTWTVGRAGTAHGLVVWFDTDLAKGIGFSNAPSEPELIYGNAFFPWSQPILLAEGDHVTVTFHADLVGEDYVWGWNTRVLDQGDPVRIKADFKQSTFFGVPVSPSRLRKRAAGHVPVLDGDGQIDRQILTLMDGEISLGEIARRVQDQFPARFASWRDALTRVGELSKKYSR